MHCCRDCVILNNQCYNINSMMEI